MVSEIKVNFDFSKLEKDLPNIIKEYLNDEFAGEVVKASKEKIIKGQVEPSLAESTIEIRRRRGTGGSRPLYETGALHDSLTKSKDGIEVKGYGGQHLKGYVTSSNSMIKSKNVPARNFIAIPKVSHKRLIKRMKDSMKLQSPVVLKP
jgi:phage gpG-like protein